MCKIAKCFLFVVFSWTTTLSAQYPTVPDSIKRITDSIKSEYKQRSAEAWEKASLVVQQQALEGKPFIPWASRPCDLPQATIPAFPGAEGGGMYSFGGRGGKVLTVTNLNDRGPGTLREACETGGARIIVFNVSGIIRLKAPIDINAPYVTIAGQTAPGDGVCIAGESFNINTHDVIVRHMRFRRGTTNVGRRDDAIGGNPIGNIIIDHVSASWGLDENMSFYRHNYNDGTGSESVKLPTVNLTIQNSIFSEALDTWNHSFGSTLGGENCSFMRNLWAKNAGRNPSIGWYGVFNLVNNVIFNWNHRTVDGGDYRAMYNIIGNYYKPGPATPDGKSVAYRILKPDPGRSKLKNPTFGRCYVVGNIVEGNDSISNDNWKGGIQFEKEPYAGSYTASVKSEQPFEMPNMNIMTAQKAYKFVLENAGALFPKRDPVDRRIVREVRTGIIEYAENVSLDGVPQFKYRGLPADSYKMGIITDIGQVGGYPEYQGTPYTDTDNDGMPDAWEKKHAKLGLNYNDPTDAVKDCNGDGYTNIEKYINGIDPKRKVDWQDLKNNHDTLTKKGGVRSN